MTSPDPDAASSPEPEGPITTGGLDALLAVLRQPPTPTEAARNRAEFDALRDRYDNDPDGRRRVQGVAVEVGGTET